MKLINLYIENFKGIEKFKLESKERNVNIHGTNGSGKTSIYDSFLWLLFDKNSDNKTKFEVKPLNQQGDLKDKEAITKVIAEVEVNDEVMLLEKRHYVKEVKVRGSNQEVRLDNTTEYFIDELQLKATDFNKRISEICSEDIFKLLTNPKYFNEELSWQERRTMLNDLIGDIKDEDVFESNNELELLRNNLGKHDLKDFSTIQKRKEKEILKELESLNAKISELTNNQEKINIEESETVLERLEKELKDKQQRLFKIENNSIDETYVKRINEIETEANGLRERELNREKEERNKFNKNNFSQNEEANKEIILLNQSITNTALLIEKHNIQLENLIEKRTKLRNDYKAIQEAIFEIDETCPTCKQSLPEDRIQGAKEEFKINRSIELTKLVSGGEENNESIKSIEKVIDKLKETQLADDGRLNSLNLSLKTEEFKFEESKEVDNKVYELAKEKSDIQNKLKNQEKPDTIPLETEIKLIELEMNKEQENVFKYRDQEKNKQRINELTIDRVDITSQLDLIEQLIYLSEVFFKKQSKLLEDKVNEKFNIVKFKLFRTLENGNVTDDCVATIEGVPYADVNNANKINAGLDIINTLSNILNFTAPIFIDNAESVVKLHDMETQIIRLVVDEKSGELSLKGA